MINRNATNFHVEYMDVTQHWSPTCEKYAGGDALLTALYNNWQMENTVTREDCWFAGMRLISVYHVPLKREGEEQIISVIDNPYVSRLMNNGEIRIIITESSPENSQQKAG
jgi:hypothetical protein